MSRKRWKKGILAAGLAAAVVSSGLYLSEGIAASAIETDRMCSLTISLPEDSEYIEDMRQILAPITINLYRVASLNEKGEFLSTEAFAGLDLETLEDDSTDAWVEKAEEAYAIVEASDAVVADAADELEIDAGTLTIENLETGMYLVVPETSESAEYEYVFSPYLISLPDNYYYQTGDAADDAWVYDVAGRLKFSREPRYGSLQITKTLDSFNGLSKSAVFVFEVEGTKDGEVVYSNAVSIAFDAAGSRTAVLDHIQAGTEVTVTEVYSGASYKLTSDATDVATIVADGLGEMAQVDFTNTYDNTTTVGSGVANHFTYDEVAGWDWEQKADSTDAAE